MNLSLIKAFKTSNTPDQPFPLRRLSVTWIALVKVLASVITPFVALVRDLAGAGTLAALVGVEEANRIINVANGLGHMSATVSGTDFTPIPAVVAPEPSPTPEPTPAPTPEPTAAPTPETTTLPSDTVCHSVAELHDTTSQAATPDKPTGKSRRNANA